MKRCPNCNRTYMNAAQKFCTLDGTPLLDTTTLPSGQGETIRIDSTGLKVPTFDDEATQVISRKDLETGDLDPYKTMVNEPRAQAPAPPIDPEMTVPAMRVPMDTPAPSGPAACSSAARPRSRAR